MQKVVKNPPFHLRNKIARSYTVVRLQSDDSLIAYRETQQDVDVLYPARNVRRIAIICRMIFLSDCRHIN